MKKLQLSSQFQSMILDLFAIETFTSSSQTIAANGTSNFQFNVSKSGYTPIGILAVDPTNTNNVILVRFSLYDNTAYIRFRNPMSYAIDATVAIKVLYTKN